MANQNYILLRSFSRHAHIEDKFIRTLHEFGLITLEKQDEEEVIDESQISEIERFFRLHTDLGINYEGLDVIAEMLKRVEDLEKEMELLRKKLRLYE